MPGSTGTRVWYIAAQVKPDDDERQHLSNCSSPFHLREHNPIDGISFPAWLPARGKLMITGRFYSNFNTFGEMLASTG